MRIGSQDKGKPGSVDMSRKADVGRMRHYFPRFARVSSRYVEITTHDSGCAYEEWDGNAEFERRGARGAADAPGAAMPGVATRPNERAGLRRVRAPVDRRPGLGSDVEQGPGKAHVRSRRGRHGFRRHADQH